MEWLLIVVSVLHLLICPFTKVEESFNLQATHDILAFQTDLGKYDHLEFPGVVPRSFIGPLIISAIAAPFVTIADTLESSKWVSLIIVRLILGALVLWPLLRIKKRVRENLGEEVSFWFLLITLSQFHFIFYLSRPLPNTMALPLVLFAFDFWLARQTGLFITFSAAAILIFRGELAILMGFILIGELLNKRISISKTLNIAIPSGLIYLSATILVDSYFWQRWLWPEGEVLWYNTYLNKSADWGTSPFWWYFYSAIPRAMGASVVFLPIGLLLEKRIRWIMWQPLLFVLLYSVLPHKELRFIIYVFPLLNVAAATACSRLWENRTKSKWRALLALGAAGHLLANLVMSCFLLTVSHANYPGGVALAKLHQLEPAEANVTVHIDVAAAQTGVSRFGQFHQHWRHFPPFNSFQNRLEILRMFTHLIVEAKSVQSVNLRPYVRTHEILAKIEGFSHIRSSYIHFPPIRIKYKPAFFILKNKSPPRQPQFDFNSPTPEEGLQDLQESSGEEENPPDYDFEFTNHFEGDTELPPSGSDPNEAES
uniref:Mannosyltransferase n=1 Tax=Evadne anonyx TaxID=141404 RepID=A0A9N6WX50_9CRUS|nr:EOG090X04MD [Evadne anonyx]